MKIMMATQAPIVRKYPYKKGIHLDKYYSAAGATLDGAGVNVFVYGTKQGMGQSE